MYRPEGWKPIDKPFYVVKPPYGNYISAGDANSLYEAGADAMLEALLSQAHQDWLATPEGESCKGRWAFIPKEE